MPEKYVKRMNFGENLTPLDSLHLEVFLGIFWGFFIFLNSNLNFEFGPNRNRAGPEPDYMSRARHCRLTTDRRDDFSPGGMISAQESGKLLAHEKQAYEERAEYICVAC